MSKKICSLDQLQLKMLSLSIVLINRLRFFIVFFFVTLCTPHLQAQLSISLKSYGAKGDGITDDTQSIQAAMTAVQRTNGKIVFPAGKYLISRRINVEGWKNCMVEGEVGAILLKATGPFVGEALLQFKNCTGLKIKGLSFFGQTESRVSALVPGDGGLYIYDSHGVEVTKNQFFNCGDAAFRIATLELINGGVNASDVRVSNNYIKNCHQTSTTYNAGVANYSFTDNMVEGLKGSIKFASRKPGARNLLIARNKLTGCLQNAFEIVGYSDYTVENNEAIAVDDCKGYGMNIYAPNFKGSIGQPQKNGKIEGNLFSGFLRGIRLDNGYAADSVVYQCSNITIVNNRFLNCKGDAPVDAAITLSGSKIEKVLIKGNLFDRIVKNGVNIVLANDRQNNQITIQKNKFERIGGKIVESLLRNVKVENNVIAKSKKISG